MKKLFLTLAVACLSLTANAQEKGEIRLGAIAGMNISNIAGYSMSERIGFHVGAKAEYNFNDGLYANAGLLFTQKGCTKDENDFERTHTPGYLEIPINLGYRYSISEGVGVFGETGPYFAFGICGKSKSEYKINGHSEESKDDFFGEKDVHRFDLGWGLKVGVEVHKFQIAIGYEFSIPPVSTLSNEETYNTNVMVSVSYML